MNKFNTDYFLFEDTGISNDQNDNGSKEVIFKADAYYNGQLIQKIENDQNGIITTDIDRLVIPQQNIFYRKRFENENYINSWILYHSSMELHIQKQEEDNVIPYKLETNWVNTPDITDDFNPLIYTNYNYSHTNYRSFRRPTNEQVNEMLEKKGFGAINVKI